MVKSETSADERYEQRMLALDQAYQKRAAEVQALEARLGALHADYTEASHELMRDLATLRDMHTMGLGQVCAQLLPQLPSEALLAELRRRLACAEDT